MSTAAVNSSPGVWDSLTLTLFISKLELLRDFLSLCKTASAVFKGDNIGQQMPTGDILISPVKKYIAEFVQVMLLGTGPKHLTAAIVQFAR